MGGFVFQSRLCAFSALVLQSTVVLLLLTRSNRVDSQGVGPSQTITALVGEDVVLPCHLEPAVDATSESVEWARHDLEPRFVHVWHDGQDLLETQNPSYKGRTLLPADNLKHGDLSLKLSAVKLSDNGVYTCFFPSQKKDHSVQLVVGSSSSPVISGIYRSSDELDLQSESEVDSQGVEASQTITALVGEDVVLPCHLEPAVDATSESVEWARHDLEPRFVHVWHDGLNLLENQNPSYKGRTSLPADNLKHGDLSLKLSAVKLSDNGVYTCFFPSQYKEFSVQLVVGSFSSPVISGIYRSSDGLGLQCESKGWYPEPEVSWLDGEGNIISTAQTKTVRGSDDLFTVSSRVTVGRTHGNTFTCRVQQKNISQTRETSIYVSADIFEAPSSAAVRVSIVVVILLGFVAVSALVLWKFKKEAEKGEEDPLMTEEKKTEDLEERKKRLEEDLKKNEEEQRDLEEKVHKLTDHCKELKKQVEELRQHREDRERINKDIDEKFKSAETTAERDKAEGFLDMKTVALTAKNHLKSGEKEDKTLLQKTQNIQNFADSLLNTLTERKRTVENQQKEISDQLEEIERKLSTQKT